MIDLLATLSYIILVIMLLVTLSVLMLMLIGTFKEEIVTGLDLIRGRKK